jgi:hypothetical protein
MALVQKADRGCPFPSLADTCTHCTARTRPDLCCTLGIRNLSNEIQPRWLPDVCPNSTAPVEVYKQLVAKSNKIHHHLLAEPWLLLLPVFAAPLRVSSNMLSPHLPNGKFDDVVNQLSLAEKVGLLSGGGACRTSGLDRLNIPSLNVSPLTRFF